MVAKAPPARLLIPAQRRPSRERLLAAEPFFLVLDDMRHRELGSRPVTL